MNDASPEMMSIFCAALERLSAQERAAYLETACGRDMELRARLEALLQAHDQAGGFLPEKAEVPETHASVAHPSREGPATVIGATSCCNNSARAAWAPSSWPSKPSLSSARLP